MWVSAAQGARAVVDETWLHDEREAATTARPDGLVAGKTGVREIGLAKARVQKGKLVGIRHRSHDRVRGDVAPLKPAPLYKGCSRRFGTAQTFVKSQELKLRAR